MYTTISNIEARIGTLTTAQTDYATNVLLPAVDDLINNYIGEQFASTGSAEVYASGNGSRLLTIPTMNTITAVEFVNDDGTTSAIDTTAYSYYPGGTDVLALYNKNGTWAEGFNNYKVTGKLGGAVAPASVTFVATELAAKVLNAQPSNMKSERVENWSVTYKDVESYLTPELVSLLGNYRRLSTSI